MGKEWIGIVLIYAKTFDRMNAEIAWRFLGVLI